MNSSISDIKKKCMLPSRFKNSEESIWNESTALKLKYPTSIDLSQGFPNYLPNESAVKILTEVASSGDNKIHQYSPNSGHPRLKNVVSALNSRILNRHVNPLTEILITCGAYEAIYSSIVGNIETGDEVIIIEPFFDCYEPMVLVAGGIVKYIPLRKSKHTKSIQSSSDWKLDEQELREMFNEKTKMIILNTPMNPTGKVFSEEELNIIAELCIKHDVLCVTDEVYEFLVYEPARHIKIASLPGMWDRTITIGSAGKALCVTGWKCGWACAPAALIYNARVVHLLNVDSIITPIQLAVAQCLEIELKRLDSEDSLFKVIAKRLKTKRDYFVKLLSDAGFQPIVPDGGYFIVADWTFLKNKIDLSTEQGRYEDYKLMKWMAKNIGLLTIPPSTFYSDDHKKIGENLIRFCFFKTDEVLKAGAECLSKLKS